MNPYADVKLKITMVIANWERDHAHEFLLFLSARKAKTLNLRTKFGETDQKNPLVERLLFELPESLDSTLTAKLNEEELKFFHSKPGALWFAKSFKQYTVPEKI